MNVPLRIVTTPEKARLRVDDFLLLDGSGAFSDFTKTELIEGEIYVVNAQHSRHARMKSLLLVELAIALRSLGSNLEAWSEVSTRISDVSLPEPDIVLTRHRGEGVVPLESVALIVEVSDTTLEIDMGRKLRVYAEANVPEYWVIDLSAGHVVRLWEPSGGGYARRNMTPLGELVESATIVGLAVITEQ